MLLNWPPSRGPNPDLPKSIVYKVGDVIRKDSPRVKSDDFATGCDDFATEKQYSLPGFADEPSLDGRGSILELPVPRNSSDGDFLCNYHIATVQTLTLEQADMLLDVVYAEDLTPAGMWCDITPASIKTKINYPLNLGVELTIFPYEVETVWEKERRVETYMSPGYFIWIIAQEYKRIYEEHEKYGVWGHALTDLYVEGFTIKDGYAGLSVGS
jgi:hypothetical protein